MEDHKNRLLTATELVRGERRKYNKILLEYVEGKAEVYNGEDLMRLVGQLEATYNHLLAALASDGDIYCVLKHLSYAIVLAGEMDIPNVDPLYEIMTIVTDGAIEPCQSCKDDANAIIEVKEDYGNDNAN